MEKQKTLLLLLSIFSTLILQAKPNTDLEKCNLQGKVKSATQAVYKAKIKNGNIVRGEKRNTKDFSFAYFPNEFIRNNICVSFNNNGNITEIQKKECPSCSIKYTYKDGIFVELEHFHGNSLYLRSMVLYHQNGQINQKGIYYSKSNTILAKYFNMEGEIVLEETINLNTNKKDSSVYSHTVKNNEKIFTKYKISNGKKTFLEEEIRIYDEDNNLEKIIFKDENKEISEEVYYYKTGNKKEETLYDKDNLVSVNVYNEKGQIIECRPNKNESLVLFYTYDKFGNIESDDKKIRYTYIYDVNNNWTSQLIYRNGKLKYIIDRQIEYYE